MARKRYSTYRPPALDRDRARPRTVPAPSAAALTDHLADLLWPLISKQQPVFRAAGLRDRQLGIPVMVGLVLALIWRQIPSVRELVRVLERESLLWVAPQQISQQAVSRRLRSFPADLFGSIVTEMLPILQARIAQRRPSCAPVLTRLQGEIGAVWAVDGSTLEVVGKRVGPTTSPWSDLGGRIEAVIDLATRLPVTLWYSEQAQANDRRFLDDLQAVLPPRTLLVLDRGFYSFGWFDWLSDHDHRFLTRPRTDARYTVIETLTDTDQVRDRLVHLGADRARSCRHRVRLVELRHGTVWHAYLTNWLDPTSLPAADVATLYAERWRIEDAFLQTKRLLGLSYLWSADRNAILLQVWATWLLYAVLVDLCAAIADRLDLPLARISTEMVLRGLYHYAVAVQGGYGHDPVTYLSDPANRRLGVVKRPRHRHPPA